MKMMFFSTENHKYNVKGVKMLIFAAGDIETVKKGNRSPLCNHILNSLFVRGHQRLPVTSLFPPPF